MPRTASAVKTCGAAMVLWVAACAGPYAQPGRLADSGERAGLAAVSAGVQPDD